MEKTLFEQLGGTYIRGEGDYLIPNLTTPEDIPMGIWGMRRRRFLWQHRNGIYTGMLLSGKLNAHFTEIDRQATELFERLTRQMAAEQGVTETPVTNYGSEKIFNADYSGSMSKVEFMAWWKSMDLSTIRAECEKMAAEAQELIPGYTVTMYFYYGGLPLGNANAMNGYTISNFDLASAWIK